MGGGKVCIYGSQTLLFNDGNHDRINTGGNSFGFLPKRHIEFPPASQYQDVFKNIESDQLVLF